MKLTFETAAFAAAAKAVRGLADTSLKIDLMAHARIEAKKGKLALTVSNFDQEATARIDCGKGDVLAAVPFAMVDFFASRDAGEGTIEFELDMKDAVARHGRARLKMSILPGADFPLMTQRDPSWSFAMRAHELTGMLTRCDRAVERTREDRPMLNGAFLNIRDGALWIVASDSHRLHAVQADGVAGDLPPRPGFDIPGVILPARAIKEILRVWGGDETEVTISGTDAFATIAGEALTLTTKLIDSTYFDYPKFISAPGDGEAEVETAALVKAIDAVMLVPKTEGKGASAKLRAVRLSFADDRIEVFAKGDIGEAEDVVSATVTGAMAGKELVCVASYLKDAAAAADAPKIRILAPAEGIPFFRIAGRDDSVIVVGQRKF
jgi:DNA polymerase-3 subunit beta